MKKILLFLSIGLGVMEAVQAQNDTDLFISDMLVLAEPFAQPAANAASYQAGAGWFSTAAILGDWDFRLSAHGNLLMVPEEETSYFLRNSDLQLLELEGREEADLSTAFGGIKNIYFTGEVTNPVNPSEKIAVRFQAFRGVGRKVIPHAFVQGSVGLPGGTEFTLRAMPEVTIDGVTASTFGAGLKHSLSQYWTYNESEDIQLALGLAYSKLNVGYEFDAIEVDQYLLMNLIDVDADLWLGEVLASKRFNALEVFVAAGAMSSSFKYRMGGGGLFLPLVNTQIDTLEDSQLQFKGDLGLNIYVGLLRLSTTLSFGEFTNANVGLHVRI